jgi:hypothetical protein
MTNNFTIKKYFGLTLLLVFCAVSSVLGQELSDKEIGFDVAKITNTFKKQGMSGKDIEGRIKVERNIYKRYYSNMKKEGDAILEKIKSKQIAKGVTNRSLAILDIPQSEKIALKLLYDITTGDAWTNTINNKGVWQVNDPNAIVTSWDQTTQTGWFGVTVLNGHVTGLNFSYNNLDNYNLLFPNISGLTYLESLTLYGNPLKGSLDNFKYLTSLKSLFIARTQFTGTLSNLSPLVNLEDIYINDNSNFTGSIPDAFYGFANLRYLNLGYSNLSGGISPLIGNLKNLETLIIRDNIRGIFPVELCNLLKLKTLEIPFPYFEAEFPTVINKLVNLEVLTLNGRGLNNIKYKFPLEVFDLLNLRRLQMDNFSLGGNIPAKIGKLKMLTQLYLDDDDFYGEIPSEFLNLIALRTFWLTANQFRFIDLARLFPTYKTNLTDFFYSGQQKTDTEKTINGVFGGSITLTMCEDGRYLTNTDTFQWYKGVSPNGIEIQGATSRVYTINNLNFGNAGDYYCLSKHPQMTNPVSIYENLVLESNPIHLKFANCAQLPGDIGILSKEGPYTCGDRNLTFGYSGSLTNLNYTWNLKGPDGTLLASSTNSSFLFTLPGINKVELVITEANGCVSTFVYNVSIVACIPCTPIAGQLVYGDCFPTKGGDCPPYTCGNRTIYAPSLIVNGNATIVDYQWTFKSPNGTILGTAIGNDYQNQFTYTTLGNNSVELTVTEANGCKSNFMASVPVVACPTTCPAPTNLVISNYIVGSSATISWTETGTATSWIVTIAPYGYYGSGLPPDTSGTITNENPYKISYIPPGFPYQVYVKAICGPNSLSDWSNPVTVSTSTNGCPVTITATEETVCIDKQNTFTFNPPTAGLTYDWVLYDQNLNYIDSSNQPSYTTVVSVGCKLVLTVTDSSGNKSIFIKKFGVTSCCGTISDIGGNIQTSSRGCLNQDMLFTFVKITPAANIAYQWSLIDENGIVVNTSTQENFTINTTIAGYYSIKLIVTNQDACAALYTTAVNIKACSCTITNPESGNIKETFIDLLNGLIIKSLNGETDAQINGSNPPELVGLHTYITGGVTDKIYNFVTTRNPQGLLIGLQFSFSPDRIYDVYLTKPYNGITKNDFEIDLEQYTSSNEYLITCFFVGGRTTQKKSSTGKEECPERLEIRNIEFCPTSCASIPGTIVGLTTTTNQKSIPNAIPVNNPSMSKSKTAPKPQNKNTLKK